MQLNLFESPENKPAHKIKYIVRLSSYYNRNQDDSFRTFASEEAAKDCLDRHKKAAFYNTGYIVEEESEENIKRLDKLG